MNPKILAALILIFLVQFVFCQSKQSHSIPDTINFKYGPSDDNFVGPFASWCNIKTDFGAVGNGIADDTKAIQKALDFLHYSNKRILYFPAGTYRITQTLTLTYILNIGIMGEDPANTTIKWDGPNGGVMIDLNGVSYSHYGRITWDGCNKALTAVMHAWDGKKPPANTDSEHADEVFKNVVYGIRGGTRKMMDAECVVKRCHFENCKNAAISLENFNAADWEVWYCTFKHCGYGVTNNYGAGYFNVYYCCFIGSQKADIGKYHCGFRAARFNTSVNSAKFFFSQNHNCPGLTSIQGNHIYYPTSSLAFDLGDIGPNLLLDNTVISRPEFQNTSNTFIFTGQSGVSIGNQYSSNPPISCKTGMFTSIQDKNTPSEKLEMVMPTMPGTAPLSKAAIVDIPVGVNETVIQKMIDSATKKTNAEIVFHFPAGKYFLGNTITLPPNKKIQLVGDGFDTKLIWTPNRPGSIFLLKGPSQATLREIQLDGKGIATGIEITHCDQQGSQVFMDQACAKGSAQSGLLYDSLDNTLVYLRNFYHEASKQTSIVVKGGNKKAKGIKTDGIVAIYCGASANSIRGYDVRNNGELLVNDVWYEASKIPSFMYLSDSSSGNITLNGGVIATAPPPLVNGQPDTAYYPILVDGFKGNLSMINEHINCKMLVTNKNNPNVLAILDGKGDYFKTQNTNPNNVAFWASCLLDNTGGALPLEKLAKPTDDFILKMLQQLRTQIPQALQPMNNSKTTDVRIYRLNVVNAAISFHIKN